MFAYYVHTCISHTPDICIYRPIFSYPYSTVHYVYIPLMSHFYSIFRTFYLNMSFILFNMKRNCIKRLLDDSIIPQKSGTFRWFSENFYRLPFIKDARYKFTVEPRYNKLPFCMVKNSLLRVFRYWGTVPLKIKMFGEREIHRYSGDREISL